MVTLGECISVTVSLQNAFEWYFVRGSVWQSSKVTPTHKGVDKRNQEMMMAMTKRPFLRLFDQGESHKLRTHGRVGHQGWGKI